LDISWEALDIVDLATPSPEPEKRVERMAVSPVGFQSSRGPITPDDKPIMLKSNINTVNVVHTKIAKPAVVNAQPINAGLSSIMFA
jgi:hypothetical protein